MNKNKKRMVQENFPTVIDMVSKGVSLDLSLKAVAVSRKSFYRYITTKQRELLDVERLRYYKEKKIIL
tara:strand:- start:72 stop:275 length:204 start_codon:yes stop_codon:yes gene_type:complete